MGTEIDPEYKREEGGKRRSLIPGLPELLVVDKGEGGGGQRWRANTWTWVTWTTAYPARACRVTAYPNSVAYNTPAYLVTQRW